MQARSSWLLSLAALAPLGWGQEVGDDHAAEMAAGVQLFKESVRPIFVEDCLYCHGGGKVKGDFDLSVRERLLEEGLDGPRVSPGDPENSWLLKLVRHEEVPHMPDKADKLADEDIKAIEEWIRLGAPYDRPLVDNEEGGTGMEITELDRSWWAYRPLERPELPLVARENGRPMANGIDHFWRSKLDEAGVSPAGRADGATLERRRSFALWGLPPDSVERTTDEMLNDLRFGERWARHWLDIVRFGESHGYEHDYDRPNAWHYRDFIIRSLASDQPYDEFLRWQLAGDELAPEEPDAWRATGFLAAGTHSTQITKNQVEKERYDELADMVGVFGTSMMGTTIGCARCHDHKFDPLPTRDFYRLCATFTKTVRSDHELTIPNEALAEEIARHDETQAALQAELDAYESGELTARFEEWLREPKLDGRETWKSLEFEFMTSEGGATFDRLDDGSIRVGGPKADHDVHVFQGARVKGPVTALRLEALADDGLVKRGPGRADNGNFGLSDIQIFYEHGGPLDFFLREEPEITAARASFDQAGLPVTNAIDDDDYSCWAVDPEFGKDHAAVFEFAEPVYHEAGTTFTVRLSYKNNVRHQIGRPRLSVTGKEGGLPLDLEAEPAAIQRLRDGATLTDADRDALFVWYRKTDDAWLSLKTTVTENAAKRPAQKKVTMLVSSEGLPAVRLHTQGGDFLEETHLLNRGDPGQKGDIMTPGFLQVMTGKEEGSWLQPAPEGARTPHHRANLARWLTDLDGGAGALVARVIANRVWQHHFGRGIVTTPDDFGIQGNAPTHPELLEWLAVELVESGWSLHHLHRLILESECWKQSSEWSDRTAELDPENELLWRFTPRRLEGEVLRDSLLAVSGLLDPTPFGKGTLDSMQRRRSVYFTVKRSRIVPMLRAFDGPDALGSLPARATTTVAPQALFLMNDPAVRSWAEHLAGALAAESAVDSGVVHSAWDRILGRAPSAEEEADAAAFLGAQTAAYSDRTAAITDLCQALFATNEFAYVD
ncbi:MAG: PSD1 and planctomycete cytochrome C domain-containing protein [Planctomycetota bacterium]|nr:PSD1 and planctomycete cytochrome C domain-containing protein [Planctomycetota bacterium]